MPIPGARYRYRTTSSGKKQRLAFKGDKVVEVKNEGQSAKMVRRNTRKSSRSGSRR